MKKDTLKNDQVELDEKLGTSYILNVNNVVVPIKLDRQDRLKKQESLEEDIKNSAAAIKHKVFATIRNTDLADDAIFLCILSEIQNKINSLLSASHSMEVFDNNVNKIKLVINLSKVEPLSNINSDLILFALDLAKHKYRRECRGIDIQYVAEENNNYLEVTFDQCIFLK